MERFTQFLKSWGSYTLVAIFAAALVLLFIISSECKNDSAFLRIIYGVITLMPAGVMTAWMAKKGLEE